MSSVPERTTAGAVSSQELSMPRMKASGIRIYYLLRSSSTAVLKDFATSIVRKLREHDHKAYLVGGCVRDLLLGREPADYDVATSATPTQVMEIFPETFAVGVQFGVVLVPLPARDVASNVSTENSDHASCEVRVVEVATFRSDIG